MRNVYIDSNVIVSAEIQGERNHAESKEFMDFLLKVKVPDVYYVTSVFTFVELASAMIRRTGDRDGAILSCTEFKRLGETRSGHIRPRNRPEANLTQV